MPNDYARGWRDTVVQNPGSKARLRRAGRKWLLDLKAFLNRRDDPAFLRCLACHYVFDDQRDAFAEIIAMLKNRGQFVDTKTCLSMVSGDSPIDGRYFHLSFDDGFKNVIDNALPILSDAKVPMILFVPARWIGADWETARNYSINIAMYRNVVEMATWDDLRQMTSDGFEIGSHTMTHARLSTLSGNPELLAQELVDSKVMIERELGTECTTIAYPYGKPGDYDDTTLAATDAAGYAGGFCIHRGAVLSNETPKLMIPRHHFEPEWPLKHIRYFSNGNMEDRWARQVEAAGVGKGMRDE